MNEYAYSKRLKTPSKMPDLDFSLPTTETMAKIIVRTQLLKTEKYNFPKDCLVEKKKYESKDGESFDTWIISAANKEKENKALLYIHGGAYYLPVTCETLALACEYAKRLKVDVYIPEYRLVPNYVAPKALEDCISLYEDLIKENDIAILGESAGGALAAGMCGYLLDNNIRVPKGLLLIYPVLDKENEGYPSKEKYKDAIWSLSANNHMWEAYLKDCENEYLVPMKRINLSGFPQTYIEPQEIDILCDEAIVYAERLKESHVQVDCTVIPNSYHGFDGDLESELVQEAIEKRIKMMETMFKK